MNFGLEKSDYELLFKLAIDPLKQAGANVWIFGSRARKDYKKFSDCDLLFEFPPQGRFSHSDLILQIREALENSSLSVKVDLVERKNLAHSYAAQVEQEKISV